MQPEEKLAQRTLEELESLWTCTLEDASSGLGAILRELASRLRPFPAFMNMGSIQAVELEPSAQITEDRGCVVVCPDGEIRHLELTAIPGAGAAGDVEQVEQFRELEMSAEEYIVYAEAAIQVLSAELRRRGS